MKIAQKFLVIIVVMSLFLSACISSTSELTSNTKSVPVVFGAYATSIEEPWDGVIHTALLAAQAEGRITYTWQDTIGYQGDMERILLKELGGDTPPDIIFGDAFGNEEAVRTVAAQHPTIAFAFGSL